jgi:hypothetical protein
MNVPSKFSHHFLVQIPNNMEKEHKLRNKFEAIQENAAMFATKREIGQFIWRLLNVGRLEKSIRHYKWWYDQQTLKTLSPRLQTNFLSKKKKEMTT